MSCVGIIANPSAGKDIRRLVASGRVVSDQEKANTLKRVFAGLAAMSVERVLVMPDPVGLARPGTEEYGRVLTVDYVDMPPAMSGVDSTRAARSMADEGVGCIVTLGGDGTNRVVAMGCREVPIVPISTGTNNVFPQMVEGTLAGMAAGALAAGHVAPDEVCKSTKRLEVFVDGEFKEIALIDAAVSRELFAGTRAIWDPNTITEVFLTRAEPAAIGLSAIGARLKPIALDEPIGLYIRLGDGGTRVMAPVGPGTVYGVPVREWNVLRPGDRRAICLRRGMVALDGEREVSLLTGREVEVELSLNGPRVVDIRLALEELVRSGAETTISKHS